MERFNRAERRHQTARLKAKRKSYRGYGASYGTQGILYMSEKQLGRIVQYPQACSCSGCGNSRKYFGRTLKELVHIHDLNEELSWQSNPQQK
jgi:hypothetical protein